MEVKAYQGDDLAAKPPKTLRAALIFGPDQGLVRERADTLARTAVADLSDPFQVAEFSGDALESDPSRLAAEANAIPMLGGRRVVRVRGVSNTHADIFRRYLENPSDALVIAEGGDLTPTGIRNLFKSDKGAIGIPCYPDNARNLFDVVRGTLKAAGIAADPDAMETIVSRLGSDRGVTRSELEKLRLYAADTRRLTEADVLAIMGDESELRVEEACDAAAQGDQPRVDSTLERLWAAGTSPHTVLRAALSHFQRLLAVKAAIEEGSGANTAIDRLRPPPKGPRRSALEGQLGRWTCATLTLALDAFYEAEALTRTTGVPAEAAAGRAFIAAARRAQPSNR